LYLNARTADLPFLPHGHRLYHATEIELYFIRWNTSLGSETMHASRIAGLCFLGACLLSSPAIADPTTDRDAALKLLSERLRDRPPPVLSNPQTDKERTHFQFEALWYPQDSPDVSKPAFRVIFEADGKQAAMLVMSPEGTPYALFSEDGLYFCSSDETDTLIFIPDVHARLAFPAKSIGMRLDIALNTPTSQCNIDLRQIAEFGSSSSETCRHSQLNQTADFTSPRGSRMRIIFSRERYTSSYPIAQFSMRSPEGYGYEITSIQCGWRITRSILDLHQVLTKTFAGRIRRIRLESFEQPDDLLPLGDARAIAAIFESEHVQRTSKTWLDSTLLLESERQRSMGGFLLVLEHSLESGKESLAATDQLLALLHDRLWREIGVTSRQAFSNGKPLLSLIPGTDSQHARTRVAWSYGIQQHRSMVELFSKTVASDSFSRDARILAADILGFIGFTEPELQMEMLRKQLTEGSSNRIRNLVSTVAIRNGIGASEDIVRLKQAIVDTSIPLNERYIYLESLYLTNSADDLQDVAMSLVQQGDRRNEFKHRCFFSAAPCSSAGRSLLIHGLERDNIGMDTAAILLAFHCYKMPTSDAEWAKLTTAAKGYALDKNASGPTRILGAQVARDDLGDVTYREKFIRDSLTSQERSLIAVGFSYLQQESVPRRFLPESVKVYEHLPFEARAIILTMMFHKNSPPDLHAREFDELLQMARRDKEDAIQKLADRYQHEISTRAERR
jgi:hypothetical protein